MKKVYQSEILGVLHEMAEDLHEIGAISDERMKEHDRNCLVPEQKHTYQTAAAAEIEQIIPVTV
jgi:DNA-binding transcriptional regulator YiaG